MFVLYTVGFALQRRDAASVSERNGQGWHKAVKPRCDGNSSDSGSDSGGGIISGGQFLADLELCLMYREYFFVSS